MTLVNRKTKEGKRSGGKKRRGKNSESSDPSEKELQLFDQDEERQPQSKNNSAAPAGHTDYNPFDDESGQQHNTADVEGQAMVNEIDDALDDVSDDDEFGTLV